MVKRVTHNTEHARSQVPRKYGFRGGALTQPTPRASQYSPAHMSGRYYAEERRRIDDASTCHASRARYRSDSPADYRHHKWGGRVIRWK
eukprot:871313-Prymnesium_polylepis.1